MAFSYKVGSVAQPTITGNQAVTGVGFQPKAVVFFMNTKTADGSASGAWENVGMAVSSSSRACISRMLDEVSGNGDRAQDNTKCIKMVNNLGVTTDAADFVSLDSDGFTINWTTVVLTADILNYICFGGTDLTNASIVQFQQPTVTGNSAVTGAGFKPDAVFLISACSSTGAVANDTGTGGNFDGSLSLFTATNSGSRGVSSNDTFQKTTIGAMPVGDGTNTAKFESTFVSMDSDGFTLNWTTVSGARYQWGLCLKGGSYKVGVFNQSTSTGNQAVTGTGFLPSGIMVMSQDAAAGSAAIISGKHQVSFGAASSSSSRAAVWAGGSTGSTFWDQNLDQTKVIKMMTAATGGAPTTEAAADFVSNDSNGFTINNTTTDATSREVLYMAFGSTPNSSHFLTLLGVGV